MKQQKILLALALIASGTVTGTAQASLFDRGGGMLYDNVLNITWLQDANYAHTSGYALADSDGRMDWNTATTWATDLVYGGYSDWRLASNTPVVGDGSSFHITYSYDGTSDYGYNITSPHSELAYMYNVNLGLKGYVSTTNTIQSNFGIFGNGTAHGQNNVGLVNNLQTYGYWSGTDYGADSGHAWYFNTGYGIQGDYYNKNALLYAWAVRPGDISAVPIPGAVWLFGSGLLGLLGFKKRKTV